MVKIIVLGASGALGKHVAEQAVDAGHYVSVVVRTPSKLPASLRDKVKVHKADIMALSENQLGALLRGLDAVINTAGLVSDGDRFVTLVAHIVGGLETIEPANRPVAWFMAGAGALDIGDGACLHCLAVHDGSVQLIGAVSGKDSTTTSVKQGVIFKQFDCSLDGID